MKKVIGPHGEIVWVLNSSPRRRGRGRGQPRGQLASRRRARRELASIAGAPPSNTGDNLVAQVVGGIIDWWLGMIGRTPELVRELLKLLKPVLDVVLAPIRIVKEIYEWLKKVPVLILVGGTLYYVDKYRRRRSAKRK